MGGQILPGVPVSVPRSKVFELAEALGFDLRDMVSLEFHPEAIYAEVYADRDADRPDRKPGRGAFRFAVGDFAATHRVCIRITDVPAQIGRAHV